jgi:cytochrome c-type biogenesis protein CcmH/NrfF
MTNRVPGLTRQDDHPSVGGTNQGRVQVRNPIGDVALQPQARPVDTYARPQAPNQGPSGLMQLAGALASVSPALQNFLQFQEDKSKKDAEDRAMRRIGGMSFEEAQKAVTGGQITEMQNPWYKAAFMKQYGERLAYQRMNEWTKEWETNFDKDKGSFDDYVRQHMATDLEQYGNDPHFSGAYNQVLNQYSQRANQAQAQHQTEQLKLDSVGGVYDTFMGQARVMMQDGKSPEEIVTALRSRYEGNRTLLHIDYRDQDKEMVRLAEAFANEGNLDMAKAILNGERTGADGTVLGPLSANREFQADANRILNAAESQLQHNNGKAAFDSRMGFNEQARTGNLDQEALTSYHRKNPGAFTDAQVISLINENDAFKERQAEQAAKHEQTLALQAQSRASEANLLQRNMDAAQSGRIAYIDEATVLTPTGETKTVSVEDQKKAVAAEINKQSDWLLSQGKSPDEVFARQVEAFTANDLVNPKWKQVLAAGPVASTQFTNSGGELPDQLREGPETYMRLHNANPRLLEKHIASDRDRDWYESYRMAIQYGGASPEQAIQTATAMTAGIGGEESAGVRQTYDEIDHLVRGVRYGGFLGIRTSSPHNQGYIASEMTRLGKFYARNHLNAEDALGQAKERFLATHTEVNGNYIYTAGKSIPPNFGELATFALEKYAQDFGEAEGGKEASDLTIRPATNGNGWLIVDALTQLPVENSERANLTLRSLHEMDEERIALKKAALLDQQSRAHHKYDPWVVINDDTYIGPNLGANPSPEEQTMVKERAATIAKERRDAFPEAKAARERNAARRWLGAPDGYNDYKRVYGKELADRKKAEFEELLRQHEPQK